MPVQGVDSFIDLADFSPGIFSGYFSKTGQEVVDSGTVIPVKDGALQEDGTYGCCAGPNGGLVPLPRARAYMQDTYFRTLDDTRNFLAWNPSWVRPHGVTAPTRVPITAAKVMPAFVGPARVAGDDIPTTEPVSHNPIVYWTTGDGTLVDYSGHGYTSVPFSGVFGNCELTSPGVVVLAEVGTIPMPSPFDITTGFWVRACGGQLDPGNQGVTLRVQNFVGPDSAMTDLFVDNINANAHFRIYNTGSGIYEQATLSGANWTTLIDGNWHFIAGTFAAGITTVMLDGVLMDTDNTVSGTFNYPIPGQGRIVWFKDIGWETYGPGLWPNLTVPNLLSIYNSIAPSIASFTPGNVSGGTRPDLTSGDIAFPGLVAATYDFYSAASGTPSTFTERMIARLYKAYKTAAHDGPNLITTYYDAHSSSDAVTNAAAYFYGYADYGFTRSRHADATIIGPPFLIILAAPFWNDGTAKEIIAYPNPATLTTDTVFQIKTGQLFGLLCHQDRVAFIGHSTAEGANLPFGDTAVMSAFERLGWCAVNDFEVVSNNLATAIVSEAPFGYGCWISVNASEALLVKQVGGAVIVRNDFDSPTVVRLPGIPSTQQFYSKATNVPFGNIYGTGFIYGSIRGVWLWTGGDRADHLSPQLAGKHLVASDESVNDYLGLKGSHLYVDPYLFAPNNWIMDSRTQSWWRLRPHPDIEKNYPPGFAPPSTWYETDSLGRVYAFPSYLSVGPIDVAGQPAKGWNVFCQVYDMDTPESRWQVKTQPIARTRGKELRFRQVLCSASGHGTIACTFVGLTGAPKTVTFVVDSDEPVMLKEGLGLAAQDVVVTILADSGDPDSPAPTLHRLSLGYREAQGIGSTS